MAEASEISQPPVDPIHIASHLSVKLTRENYLLWKSELLPVLKTYGLLDLVQGKEHRPPKYLSADKEDKNPAYTVWKTRDQTCMLVIYATLSEEMFPSLVSCSRRSRSVWLKLEEEFVPITNPRVRHLKTRLLNLKKGKLMMENYLGLAEEIADGLAVAGSPLDDWEYAAHVFHGLPSDYNVFGTTVLARDPAVTREELRGLLLSEEKVVYRRRQVAARLIIPDAASNSSVTVQPQPQPQPQLQQQHGSWLEAYVACFAQMREITEDLDLSFFSDTDLNVSFKRGFTMLCGSALVYGLLEPFIR